MGTCVRGRFGALWSREHRTVTADLRRADPERGFDKDEFIDDLAPFQHGQEGTHGACDEMLKKHGGKRSAVHARGMNAKSRVTTTSA